MHMGRSPHAPLLAGLATAALVAGAGLWWADARAPRGDEAPGGGADAVVTPPEGARPVQGDDPPPPAGDVPAALRDAPAVRAAVAAAARDAGVAEAEVALVDVRETTWPSSALGCPARDRMYLDVLTPGYRVVTFAAGRRLVYHTDRDTGRAPMVVPCAVEVSKAGLPGPPSERLEALRADAAARAGDPDAAVEILAVEPSAATSLTCEDAAPASGGAALSLTAEAIWEVRVRAGAFEHRYRVSGGDLVHCASQAVDDAGAPID